MNDGDESSLFFFSPSVWVFGYWTLGGEGGKGFGGGGEYVYKAGRISKRRVHDLSALSHQSIWITSRASEQASVLGIMAS